MAAALQRCPDLLRELNHSMDVANLVVVPGEHLHARAVHDHRQRRVDNGGPRIVLVVDRHQWTLFVAEGALERPFRRALERGVHLFYGRRALYLEHAIAIGRASIEGREVGGRLGTT
jgi:hypothetical protein